MQNTILTVLAEATAWDGFVSFLSLHVLPIVNTVLATVVPIITPYVISRVSSRFAALRDNLDIKLQGLSTKVDSRLDAVEARIKNTLSLPEVKQTVDTEITRIITPVLGELENVRNILSIIANNSRIPQDVKEQVKLIPNTAHQALIDLQNDLVVKDAEIAKLNSVLIQVQSELDTKSDELTKLTEDAVKAAVNQVSKKIKAKKSW